MTTSPSLILGLEPLGSPTHRGASPPEDPPARGLLTWQAEGTSNPASRYYSRRAHVPSASSGLTIGRGYDLKLRTSAEIVLDLMTAGVSKECAEEFAKARGLSGRAAREFIAQHPLRELSALQERRLFEHSWESALRDVKRISAQPAVIERYGAIDWDRLAPELRDLLVDLRFRGDYTPATRALVQAAAAQNDLKSMAIIVSERSLWPKVPSDRFERRREALAIAPPRS